MNAVQRLAQVRDALCHFANTIGLTEEALAQAERIDEIRYTNEEFSANSLGALSLAACTPLTKICGDTLKISIRFDQYEVLSINEQTSEEEFSRVRKEIENQPSAILEISLRKKGLIERWGIQLSCETVHLFLFNSRLIDILDGTITEPSRLEGWLWNGLTCGRCLLVVADVGIKLIGPYLAIVGVEQFDAWNASPFELPFDRDKPALIYSSCRELVRWDKAWVDHISPQMLKLSSVSDETSPIAQALFAHWTNLALLFIADRVREVNSAHLAVFSTDKYRSEILLFSSRQQYSGLPFKSVEALGNIAEWAYDKPHATSRIQMVQAIIAQGLSQHLQPAPISSLLEHVPVFWRDLQWHWKTFISNDIERYTTEVRELEDEVTETIGNFDSEVAEMIKSLTSTMLGAVGALIGSLIAAAFKDPFNSLIFSAGVISFVCYVVVFPGVFSLTQHVIRFRTVKSIFERRRERYSRDMGCLRVDEIIGDSISKAQIRFWRWLTATALALAVVIGLGLIAVSTVPQLVIKATVQKTP